MDDEQRISRLRIRIFAGAAIGILFFAGLILLLKDTAYFRFAGPFFVAFWLVLVYYNIQYFRLQFRLMLKPEPEPPRIKIAADLDKASEAIIHLPIIITEGGDLSIYRSLQEAAIEIEPPDVRDGIYTVYDGKGMILNAVVIEDPKYDIIKFRPTGEYKTLQLREDLVDFVFYSDTSRSDLESLTTGELIREVLDLQGGKKKVKGEKIAPGPK